ncbi:MAG: phosphoenolpyruvate--protein phosphotransferase [Ruthenibacterium sp.]
MINLQGIGTAAGIADGPLYLYHAQQRKPQKYAVADPAAEILLVDKALAKAKEELSGMHLKATARGISEEDADIFDIQAMMLSDTDFLSAVHSTIQNAALCAEYAIHTTGEAFAAQLRTLDDPFMRARADDILDAARRVQNILTNQHETALHSVGTRVVFATETLLPSQAVQLDRSKICAFLTREGGPSSHASILARSLGIPTVTALGDDFDVLQDGARTMVDGETGAVVQCPDTQTITKFAQKMLQIVKEERALQSLKGLPATTQAGVRITLSANIALPDEARNALAHDAEGIGLFRSELLYLDANGFPEEDTLYNAYKTALLAMKGRRVLVRTLDIAEDKKVFCPDLPPETNPALGARSIPLSLAHPEILKTQLRALLRASAFGNLGIVLPMVVSAEELRSVRALLHEVRAELAADHIVMADTVALGALIETPAAAMIADILAREADFLSIGTNDLTQYMLAVDRHSAPSSTGFDQKNPAVLRMITQVAGATKAARIPLSICGECASDPSLAGFFASIGVSELSMAPGSILKMKKTIRALTSADCRTALVSALQLTEPPLFEQTNEETFYEK